MKYNDAEIILYKIRNYRDQKEAYEQPRVSPVCKKFKFLPPLLFKKYVDSLIDDYFEKREQKQA